MQMIYLLAQAAPGQSFLDYLSKAGVITLLILIVYGGYRKWWVFGWVLESYEIRLNKLQEDCNLITEEKDAWRDTALKGANIATQAFEEAKRMPRGRL